MHTLAGKLRVRQAQPPPVFHVPKNVSGTAMKLAAMIMTRSLRRNPFFHRADAMDLVAGAISLYFIERPVEVSFCHFQIAKIRNLIQFNGNL